MLTTNALNHPFRPVPLLLHLEVEMFCYTYHREIDSSLFVVGPFKTEQEAREDSDRSKIATSVIRPLYASQVAKVVVLVETAKPKRKNRKPANKVE